MIRPRHTTDLPEKLTVLERIGAAVLFALGAAISVAVLDGLRKATIVALHWLEALS